MRQLTALMGLVLLSNCDIAYRVGGIPPDDGGLHNRPWGRPPFRLVDARPAAGEHGVDPTAAFVFTFSGAADASRFQLVLAPAAELHASQWSNEGRTATVHPAGALLEETAYELTVSAWSSNTSEGQETVARYGFRTGRLPVEDVTPPVVVATAPVHGATQVPTAAVLSVTFSEPMHTGTTTNALTFQPPVICLPSWSTREDQVTCVPEPPLDLDTQYRLQLSTGARDRAGNPLAREHIVVFTTTATPDTVPPRVLSITPTGPGAPVRGSIVVEFSEPMDGTATLNAFSVSPGVPCAFTWSNTYHRLECTPTAPLSAATEYTVRVSPPARDRHGNVLDRNYTASFTTASAGQTVLTSVSPAPAATGVDRRAPLVLVFSAPMNRASVEAGLTVTPPSGAVTGTFTWNPPGTSVTFSPAAPYPAQVRVDWTLAGARDMSGAVLTANGNFTTRESGG